MKNENFVALVNQAVELIDAGADEHQIQEVIGNAALKPFIQEGDFGTISVLGRVISDANDAIILRDGYKDYDIEFLSKPIGTRDFDFDFSHEDYDGPEDVRCGHAGSVQECVKKIDEIELDLAEQE